MNGVLKPALVGSALLVAIAAGFQFEKERRAAERAAGILEARRSLEDCGVRRTSASTSSEPTVEANCAPDAREPVSDPHAAGAEAAD